MTSTRVGRKTGPKPRFNKDDVVRAALDIGIADFTLAKVAAQLGVATSAVYRIFDGRDELVDACLHHIAQELIRRPIEVNTPWRDILYRWAEETWELYDRYPGLAMTILQRPSAMLHLEHYFTVLAQRLVDEGLSLDSALFAIDFIGDTVLCSHISTGALSHANEAGTSEYDIIHSKASADFVFQPEESWLDRGWLNKKLDFIIAGLARELPHEPDEPR